MFCWEKKLSVKLSVLFLKTIKRKARYSHKEKRTSNIIRHVSFGLAGLMLTVSVVLMIESIKIIEYKL